MARRRHHPGPTRAELRARLVHLKAQLAHAKTQKRHAKAEAVSLARHARADLRTRQKAHRARLLVELRDAQAAEREALRQWAAAVKVAKKREADQAVTDARQAIVAERAAHVALRKERRREAEERHQRHHVETHQTDAEVEAMVPEVWRAYWHEVKGKVHGTKKKTRLEVFLAMAAKHPERAVGGLTEKELVKEIKAVERAIPKAAAREEEESEEAQIERLEQELRPSYLAPLDGTEKQREWAERERNKMIAKLVHDTAGLLLLQSEDPDERRGAQAAMQRQAIGRAAAVGSSRAWIDFLRFKTPGQAARALTTEEGQAYIAKAAAGRLPR